MQLAHVVLVGVLVCWVATLPDKDYLIKLKFRPKYMEEVRKTDGNEGHIKELIVGPKYTLSQEVKENKNGIELKARPRHIISQEVSTEKDKKNDVDIELKARRRRIISQEVSTEEERKERQKSPLIGPHRMKNERWRVGKMNPKSSKHVMDRSRGMVNIRNHINDNRHDKKAMKHPRWS